ncbi:hypothetical protein A0H81_02817 [Grifola frondosa]|uniref:Uncharacterized protein n=1 Tax=Grifola frondosa TaxID=5627 RepID=A0A1C7MLS9_GRIFR|nr:hypothetical protein A0H81_02817 [Grifola frondosa]
MSETSTPIDVTAEFHKLDFVAFEKKWWKELQTLYVNTGKIRDKTNQWWSVPYILLSGIIKAQHSKHMQLPRELKNVTVYDERMLHMDSLALIDTENTKSTAPTQVSAAQQATEGNVHGSICPQSTPQPTADVEVHGLLVVVKPAKHLCLEFSATCSWSTVGPSVIEDTTQSQAPAEESVAKQATVTHAYSSGGPYLFAAHGGFTTQRESFGIPATEKPDITTTTTMPAPSGKHAQVTNVEIVKVVSRKGKKKAIDVEMQEKEQDNAGEVSAPVVIQEQAVDIEMMKEAEDNADAKDVAVAALEKTVDMEMRDETTATVEKRKANVMTPRARRGRSGKKTRGRCKVKSPEEVPEEAEAMAVDNAKAAESKFLGGDKEAQQKVQTEARMRHEHRHVSPLTRQPNWEAYLQRGLYNLDKKVRINHEMKKATKASEKAMKAEESMPKVTKSKKIHAPKATIKASPGRGDKSIPKKVATSSGPSVQPGPADSSLVLDDRTGSVDPAQSPQQMKISKKTGAMTVEDEPHRTFFNLDHTADLDNSSPSNAVKCKCRHTQLITKALTNFMQITECLGTDRDLTEQFEDMLAILRDLLYLKCQLDTQKSEMATMASRVTKSSHDVGKFNDKLDQIIAYVQEASETLLKVDELQKAQKALTDSQIAEVLGHIKALEKINTGQLTMVEMIQQQMLALVLANQKVGSTTTDGQGGHPSREDLAGEPSGSSLLSGSSDGAGSSGGQAA